MQKSWSDESKGKGLNPCKSYDGEDDLAAMLALIRSRPTGRILDFPSLYDLHELLGTASRRANTQLWLGADSHVVGFAIVDLNFNTMWAEVTTAASGDQLFTQMMAWGTKRLRQPHDAISNAGVLQMSCHAEH
ncbi:MAG: hypothetical protein R3E79_59415 [Caldilineaceae bacterium]